jgi:hypothetical protein
MAAVAVDLECSVSSGFVMDPNEHQRIGWVTKLDGFGLPVGGLQSDLQVSDPLAAGNGKPMVVPVVGVLEKFSWAGGAADPLYVDFRVSQENATQLKTLQQTAKAWFTELIPGHPLSGTIAGPENPQLNVDLTPVPVKDGIDVYVYKVSIVISPQPHQACTLKLSSSSAKTAVKPWGSA